MVHHQERRPLAHCWELDVDLMRQGNLQYSFLSEILINVCDRKLAWDGPCLILLLA